MYVVDDRTRDTLGRDCIREHVVINVLPPQLIYPHDNSKVFETLPVFAWTPVSPMVSALDVTYSIRIVEIIGRQSPFAAIESNPAWFEEDMAQSTIAPYPLSAQELEPGRRYAWQVTAFVRNRKGAEGELARSEIWSFTRSALIDSMGQGGIDPIDIPILRNPGGVPGVRDSGGIRRPGRTAPVLSAPIKRPRPGRAVVTGPNSAGVCRDLRATVTPIPHGDTTYYRISIVNNSKDGDNSGPTPKGVRVRLVGNLMTAVDGGVKEGWSQSPEKIVSHITAIQWSPKSGTIPAGETELGDIRLAGSTGEPVSVLLEWLDEDADVICRDSSVINEAQFYYELTHEISGEYMEVQQPALRVQFFNDYASSDSIITMIYDAETRELVTPHGSSRTHANNLNGQNRLSIPLKDYPLLQGKPYVLVVSDYKNNYRFNFKVTNDRGK
jgi:hypothetical protein